MSRTPTRLGALRQWLSYFVFAWFVVPGIASASCAETIRINPTTIEIVNTCASPEIQVLMERRQGRIRARPRIRPIVVPALTVQSIASPEVVMIQAVPDHPPTQAELEALVRSGPEPGKTWGIPVLPRIGDVR